MRPNGSIPRHNTLIRSYGIQRSVAYPAAASWPYVIQVSRRAWCYPQASRQLASCVTSLVHGKDLVTRLSLATCEALLDEMVAAAAACKLPKYRLVLKVPVPIIDCLILANMQRTACV